MTIRDNLTHNLNVTSLGKRYGMDHVAERMTILEKMNRRPSEMEKNKLGLSLVSSLHQSPVEMSQKNVLKYHDFMFSNYV